MQRFTSFHLHCLKTFFLPLWQRFLHDFSQFQGIFWWVTPHTEWARLWHDYTSPLNVIQMCQRCPCSYCDVCWEGMFVVLLSVLFCQTSSSSWTWSRRQHGSICIKQCSLRWTCAFIPSQSDSATSIPILSLQLLCKNLLLLSSLLTYTEMNHEGTDHRLAQHTDNIFLFLSSFRWCLGNTAVSSISSKDWKEE